MSDLFRKEYTPITDEQKAISTAIKEKAEELFALYEQAQRDGEPRHNEESELDSASYRCVRIAMTRLEESVMWAVKGVTTKIWTPPTG